VNIYNARINRISEICADTGQVCLGSVVIPFLINEFDIIILLFGLMFSFIFWTGSVLLVRKK